MNKKPYYLIVGRVSEEACGFPPALASIFKIINRLRDVLVARGQMVGDAKSRQYVDFLDILLGARVIYVYDDAYRSHYY
jgi:hypothetical protein